MCLFILTQVSWYWKNLTELDHVWMPKCIRLGWILPFSPGPYEQGTWKRLYIENIQALKCITPQVLEVYKVICFYSFQRGDRL